MMVNRNDMRCTAFHEAGHAVVALVQGLTFERVFIVKRENELEPYRAGPLGQVMRNLEKQSIAGCVEEAKKEIAVCFAGPYGETLAYPGLVVDVGQTTPDAVDAISIAKFALVPYRLESGSAFFDEKHVRDRWPEIVALLGECERLAAELIQANSAKIERIAHKLLAEGEVDYFDARDLVQS